MSSGWTFEEALERARPALPEIERFMRDKGWQWLENRTPTVPEMEAAIRELHAQIVKHHLHSAETGGFRVAANSDDGVVTDWTISFDILSFLSTGEERAR